MYKGPLVLAINPGSTSTKFAVYQEESLLFSETIRHNDEVNSFPSIAAQKQYRKEAIEEGLKKHEIRIEQLAAIVGRGGFLRALSSGTYEINNQMIEDLENAKFGEHASNLGAIIAYELAKPYQIPSFIVDPIVVDELNELARFSGIPEIERKSHVHALNIKAVIRKVTKQLGKKHDEMNFVVGHLGGGISIVASKEGKLIDVNNANNEGPFSPERAGGLPAHQLVKLCYSAKYTEKEMLARLTKTGGIYAYLGTKDALEAEERMLAGDQQAKKVFDAMIYQIGKEIGAMAVVLDGKVDGVILTGGLSYSEYIVSEIIRKVKFIAPVYVVPGEEELESLALGALRVINGEEQANIY